MIAHLVLLGTATLAELKKSSRQRFHPEPVKTIFSDRRPAWLAEWADFEIEENLWNWAAVRVLVRDGLIPPPDSDFYILGMIVAPARNLPPRQLLDQDPGLLSLELWRLFECEGSGELSLAAYDKYVQEPKTWLETFRMMANDGTIDRARALAATLDALARDFAPFRAGWFSRLHEALGPTRDERVAYCERYLDLLSSRVPATVSFAMKAVVEVHDAGALDVLAVSDRLGAALDARDKGTAKRALSVLKKAALNSNSPEVKERLATLASRALGHDSADVQALAFDLAKDHDSLLEPYRTVLAPSVRARLKTAAASVTTDEVPAPVADLQRIVAVESVSELTEVLAAVLENAGPPMDIERAIDGVARITAVERLTATLAKRAEKLLAKKNPEPRTALANLVLAWTRGLRTSPPTGDGNLADFLLWRLWCVSEQAAQRQQHPLLSLPTWPDGSIDAAELAQRLDGHPLHQRKAIAADRSSLFHLDLLQAQLRAGVGLSDAPQEMHLSWKTKSWEVDGKTYFHHEPVLALPNSPKPNRFDPARLSAVSFFASLEMKRWCATVCPIWREGWFGAGCRDLGYNIDWWQADWSTRAYLEPLLDPRTAIGPMGGLLIALGLGAKESSENMLAVDALIGALSEGRFSGDRLGLALVEASASGAIKFSRWSKQLVRVAQAGPKQANAVFHAIEALFESGNGREESDYGKLVELERELAYETGLRLTRPGAISGLKSSSVGGKTMRTITELLRL